MPVREKAKGSGSTELGGVWRMSVRLDASWVSADMLTDVAHDHCGCLAAHLPRMDRVSVAAADISARRDDSAGLPMPLPPAADGALSANRGVESAIVSSWRPLPSLWMLSVPCWHTAMELQF